MRKLLFITAIAFASMIANADIMKVKPDNAGNDIDLVIDSTEVMALKFEKNIASIALGTPEFYADILESGKTLLLGIKDAENAKNSNLIVETEDGFLYEFNLTVTIDGMVVIKPMNETS